MPAPRLDIDLDKIHHNAHSLVQSLATRAISITGVTKASLGCPQIANAWLQAGVQGLADSRIENIEMMQLSQVMAPMTLIRSPMLSQIAQVVQQADISFNTELEVIRQLSATAHKAKRIHGVVLMVELGDLREGIMPEDLIATVRETLSLPNIQFKGIGTNLACRCGVTPDANNMAELSRLADEIEANFGPIVSIVSGGNSANLAWALSGAETGRVNNLRLGEALLLGCDPLNRQPIEGLYTDAFTLVAEVIESKLKPSQPWGNLGQNAFGDSPDITDRGTIAQSVLAIGQQDIDPNGLQMPEGIKLLGASSDHLVVESTSCLPIGSELSFQLNYSALLRAMTSPFVTKVMTT